MQLTPPLWTASSTISGNELEGSSSAYGTSFCQGRNHHYQSSDFYPPTLLRPAGNIGTGTLESCECPNVYDASTPSVDTCLDSCGGSYWSWDEKEYVARTADGVCDDGAGGISSTSPGLMPVNAVCVCGGDCTDCGPRDCDFSCY